jgi:predicted phosphoribosyltransferase
MFSDRADAARKLVQKMRDLEKAPGTVVTGIPPAGALIAAEVSMGLSLPIACLGLYKVPMPTRPDLTLGVIDEDGHVTLDAVTELTRHEVTKAGEVVLDRLKADMARCHEGFESPSFDSKTVVITDDAVLSPLPVQGAVDLLKRRGAKRLVLATPVISMAVRDQVTSLFDYVYVLHVARHALAVSEFYSHAAEPTLEELMISVRGAISASRGG